MKIFIFLFFSIFLFGNSDGFEYHVGVGIADITGPAAEVGMVKSKLDQLMNWTIDELNNWSIDQLRN